MIQNPLSELIEQLQKLPGIGPKSAQRLSFHFLSLPINTVEKFSTVLIQTRHRIRYCQTCFNISFDEKCAICNDDNRRKDLLCIVSEPKDIFALEKTEEFNGVYHVLGGLISPIDGIHPELLRIKELEMRLEEDLISEVILAINSTIEGDATILYLLRVLKKFQVPFTKLAYGLPIGSEIDYADELTLKKAFQGRVTV